MRFEDLDKQRGIGLIALWGLQIATNKEKDWECLEET